MNSELKGLLIRGVITARTKRTIAKDSERIIVTYRINDGNADFFVEEWNSTAFYNIGELVVCRYM